MTTLPLLVIVAAIAAAQDPGTSPPGTAPIPDLREVRARVVSIEADDEKGAGVVLGTDGPHVIIATAFHVVRDQGTTDDGSDARPCPSAAHITVAIADRRQAFTAASLVACRPDVDIALIDLNAPEVARAFTDVPRLCWQAPREQEPVSVIGHAGEEWTTSSVDQVIGLGFDGDSRRFRLTGKGTNRGDSGGPVLNGAPCLLGIFTQHATGDSRATKAEEIVALASASHLSTNLLGGTTPIDREARKRIFEDVSTTLNNYLFQLEGVHAVFTREYLTRAEFGQVIDDYNKAFEHWYQRREALSQDVAAQWGVARSQDFDGVTTQLYELHNGVVFTKLGDIVNRLTAKRGAVKIGDLKPAEKKRLDDALASLQSQLQNAKPVVTGLLDRMKPLLSA